MFTDQQERRPRWRAVGRATFVAALTVAFAAAAATPATAVNVVHPAVVIENPADWTPHMLDGTVFKFLQIGDRVYVGGSYTRVRNANSSTELPRRFLVALNKNTGQLDLAFNPILDGAVTSLVAAPDGQSLFAGGSFRTVNGTTSRSVTRLDAATGARWPGFTPAAFSGGVLDMRLLGNRLFVGGVFQFVAGADRPGLVALNATTGAVDPFLHNMVISDKRVTQTGATAPLKIEGMDVTPDGSKLVVIGNFNRIAGQLRWQLAVIDLTTNPASLHSWATNRFQTNCGGGAVTYLTGIDISANGTWFAISTKGFTFTGRLCDSATRWELTTGGSGKQPTWINYTGGDTLHSIAITGSAVYVGGHQRWLNNPFGRNSAGPGAVPREGIGAIHPVTGLALPWNPGKTRGVGTQDIYSTPEGLWIGSDGNRVNGEFHARIAFFPLP